MRESEHRQRTSPVVNHRQRRQHSLLLLAALAVLFPFLATPLAAQQPDLPHPKTLEELQAAMRDVIQKENVPGAGVALLSGGELLWCGGVGLADLSTKRPMSCDTEFRVGSISKTFVALSLLKLQEEGKINLYSRLQDVAPEIPFQNPWEASHPVRIVNLLEHTAGFDDMEASEVYNWQDRYDFPLLQVFKRFWKPEISRWPPGTRMSYSNPGNAVAGYLIEKITGVPFDKYIRETFLRPMGMEHADFPFTDEVKPLLATPYDGNPPKAGGYPFIYLRPAGDLKSSPGELAKLVQFLLRRGKAGDVQLVSTESILQMETPQTTLAARNGLRLGYGLCNYSSTQGGVVTHGHDGGIDGFISTYRYMPEQNWGYVILLNSDSSGRALQSLNQLAIDFLSRNFPKPQQPVVPVGTQALKALTGYYAPRAPRNQLFAFMGDLTGGTRIRLVNGKLTHSILFGPQEPLLPVGKNLFRGEQDPEATTAFFITENGNWAVAGMSGGGIPYSERRFLLVPYFRIAILSLCLFLMLTSLPYALVWIFLKLIGFLKNVRHLSVRIIPLLATLSFIILPLCMRKLGNSNFGTFNLWTSGIFVGTFFFPFLSVAGLLFALFVPRDEVHRAVRIHSLLVSGACCVLTGFLLSWHLFAVRLWAP